ncbi:hypothetical protein [Clostridium tyrobutyricum]|uniref:hypothetical protein n=1 Tax=Clostridium tyrobutyricum TaxID=1519 RepID=UPI001C38B628|nr:hypothetical protein [Clostridium tyrobutyricum]MBV4426169.1 hypothetical protein [Clostridium tyrobutyricum]
MRKYYNGYYKEKIEKGYKDYGFLKSTNEEPCPDYFLNGWCEIFAKEINKEFGYQIEVHLRFFNNNDDEFTDEEILSMDSEEYIYNNEDCDKYDVSLVHCYNTIHINGEKYYVDVRGITNDRTEFLQPFNVYDDDDIVKYTIAELETKFWSCENGNVSHNYSEYPDDEKADIAHFTKLAKKYIADNKDNFNIDVILGPR